MLGNKQTKKNTENLNSSKDKPWGYPDSPL